MNELFAKLGFDGILSNIASLQGEVASLKATSAAKEKEAIEQAHKVELQVAKESIGAAGVLGFYAGAAIAVAGFVFVKVQKEKQAAAYAAHKEQEDREAKEAVERAKAKVLAEIEQSEYRAREAKRNAREDAEEEVRALELKARRIEADRRLAALLEDSKGLDS